MLKINSRHLALLTDGKILYSLVFLPLKFHQLAYHTACKLYVIRHWKPQPSITSLCCQQKWRTHRAGRLENTGGGGLLTKTSNECLHCTCLTLDESPATGMTVLLCESGLFSHMIAYLYSGFAREQNVSFISRYGLKCYYWAIKSKHAISRRDQVGAERVPSRHGNIDVTEAPACRPIVAVKLLLGSCNVL
jgi:hypothetical protein